MTDQQDNTPAKYTPQMGRPKAITLDMIPIIKELAANGLNDAAIAAGIRIHPDTLSKYKRFESGDQEVCERLLQALKEGQLEAIQSTAENISKWAKKNPIVAMYQAKAILGRHDEAWLDQRQVQHSGNISVSVVKGVSGPQCDQPAIDAEYEELGEDE